MLLLVQDGPTVVKNMFGTVSSQPHWWDCLAIVQLFIGSMIAVLIVFSGLTIHRLQLQNRDLFVTRIDAMRGPRFIHRLGIAAIFLAVFVAMQEAMYGLDAGIAAGGEITSAEACGILYTRAIRAFCGLVL